MVDLSWKNVLSRFCSGIIDDDEIVFENPLKYIPLLRKSVGMVDKFTEKQMSKVIVTVKLHVFDPITRFVKLYGKYTDPDGYQIEPFMLTKNNTDFHFWIDKNTSEDLKKKIVRDLLDRALGRAWSKAKLKPTIVFSNMVPLMCIHNTTIDRILSTFRQTCHVCPAETAPMYEQIQIPAMPFTGKTFEDVLSIILTNDTIVEKYPTMCRIHDMAEKSVKHFPCKAVIVKCVDNTCYNAIQKYIEFISWFPRLIEAETLPCVAINNFGFGKLLILYQLVLHTLAHKPDLYLRLVEEHADLVAAVPKEMCTFLNNAGNFYELLGRNGYDRSIPSWLEFGNNTSNHKNRKSSNRKHQKANTVDRSSIDSSKTKQRIFESSNVKGMKLTKLVNDVLPPTTIYEPDTISECVVCLERLSNLRFFPCGHICMCTECLYNMRQFDYGKTCPLCRTSIIDEDKLESH